jgi:hypothetical protein
MRRSSFALTVCLLVTLFSAPAGAEPAKDDAVRGTAKELFDKGVQAADAGKWEECRAALLAAWNIRPTYQIAGNLAECEAKLSRWTEAARHLAFFLREIPATAPQERKKAGEALFKEVRAKVGEVTIRVSKPDAEVLVDGNSVGRAPLTEAIFVEPGARTIEARLLGKTASSTVQATAGGSHSVEIKLPEDTAPLPTGTSTVAPPPRSALPAFVLGGAAVVVAGVGIGLNVAAQDGDKAAKGIFEDIRSKAGTCVDGAPNYDARCGDLGARTRANDVMSRTSVGLFIGAGALAGGAVLYWLWPGAAPVKLGASVQPGTAASVQLSGSF